MPCKKRKLRTKWTRELTDENNVTKRRLMVTLKHKGDPTNPELFTPTLQTNDCCGSCTNVATGQMIAGWGITTPTYSYETEYVAASDSLRHLLKRYKWVPPAEKENVPFNPVDYRNTNTYKYIDQGTWEYDGFTAVIANDYRDCIQEHVEIRFWCHRVLIWKKAWHDGRTYKFDKMEQPIILRPKAKGQPEAPKEFPFYFPYCKPIVSKFYPTANYYTEANEIYFKDYVEGGTVQDIKFHTDELNNRLFTSEVLANETTRTQPYCSHTLVVPCSVYKIRHRTTEKTNGPDNNCVEPNNSYFVNLYDYRTVASAYIIKHGDCEQEVLFGGYNALV